jgi:hypothetical protein
VGDDAGGEFTSNEISGTHKCSVVCTDRSTTLFAENTVSSLSPY